MKLGKQYSEKLNCTYLDRDGRSQLVTLGYYGICVSKVAAAVVEQSHDDSGIIWPIAIAPFQVHLIALNTEDEEVRNEAENIYQELTKDGVEVLYDDRDLRAGEKFGEADLFGMPIRLTISKRTCKERKLELKFRSKSTSELLAYDDVVRIIKDRSA
jgi:prolyl-tRNA synthetase